MTETPVRAVSTIVVVPSEAIVPDAAIVLRLGDLLLVEDEDRNLRIRRVRNDVSRRYWKQQYFRILKIWRLDDLENYMLIYRRMKQA
jgi:hypothetical protein